MTDTNSIYNQLGVSDKVLRFGQEVLAGLSDQFRHIDQVAEFNQAKVIAAMQKNRVNATHFNLSTGYGYDDRGAGQSGAGVCRLLRHGGGFGAAPDHLRHPCPGAGPVRPTCCPATSFCLRWASPTTLWRRSSASGPRRAP